MSIWDKILNGIAIVIFAFMALGFGAALIYVIALVNIFLPFNWYDWIFIGLLIAFVIWRYAVWEKSSYEMEP